MKNELIKITTKTNLNTFYTDVLIEDVYFKTITLTPAQIIEMYKNTLTKEQVEKINQIRNE